MAKSFDGCEDEIEVSEVLERIEEIEEMLEDEEFSSVRDSLMAEREELLEISELCSDGLGGGTLYSERAFYNYVRNELFPYSSGLIPDAIYNNINWEGVVEYCSYAHPMYGIFGHLFYYVP